MVARRVHLTAFRFFKDIGALGTELGNQLFSDVIDEYEFSRVTSELRLHNTLRVSPTYEHAGVSKFFRVTGPQYGPTQLQRWSIAAPIVARYPELRAGGDRLAWLDFCREIVAAGLYERGAWAPRAALEDPEDGADDGDWWEE